MLLSVLVRLHKCLKKVNELNSISSKTKQGPKFAIFI